MPAQLTFRNSTPGGVQWRRMPGYPKWKLSNDGSAATDSLIIRADQFAAFVAEALPGRENAGNRLRMPDLESFIVKQIDVEPLRDKPSDPFSRDSVTDPMDSPFTTYDDYLLVGIEYMTDLESVSFEPFDNRTFIRRRVSAGGEFLSINAEKVVTKEGALGEDVGDESFPLVDRLTPIVKAIPNLDLSYMLPSVADPNFLFFTSVLGKVNDFTDPLFFDLPAETVLFIGFDAQPKWVWRGAASHVEEWDFDLRFSVRYIHDGGATYGWNHIWVPKEQKWMRVYRNEDQPLYSDDSFENIFIYPFSQSA